MIKIKNFWLDKEEKRQQEALMELMLKNLEEAMNNFIPGKLVVKGDTIVFYEFAPIEKIHIDLTVS